ncbi:Apoptotic ATPase [Handroanthus impetiginosus]|uniref:Apoptotic ATPase n=1 Tax=Handroanthus impetiginosus TaxID=429701 RepID=A0A2G9GTV3_9LAMI|nr:Apoptotic ATPase [Handroanthus impetiginosus]
MEDLAVDFLLQNLQRLQIYRPHLIREAENHLETLENNLRLFKAFLNDDATKKALTQNDSVLGLVCEINEVVYELEDIIDAVVSQAAESKTKNYFLRAFPTPPEKLLAIVKDVESFGFTIRDMYEARSTIDFAGVQTNDDELEEAPQLRKDNNVVGFEDEASRVIGHLKEQNDHLDVISIVGMAGLGKTTLAAMVFHDPEIQYEFRTRIWVCVSQDFTEKNVFLAILRELMSITDNMYRKSNKELAQLIASYLGGRRRFLIVMDDVWTLKDWDELKIAFPQSNNMGKVLITTRHTQVAWNANPNRRPHRLRFLNEEESWLLLKSVVFGTHDCPVKLIEVGRVIAKQCHGLALALMVMGGILAKTNSALDAMDARINEWEKIAESMDEYRYNLGGSGLVKFISLSYKRLPYHLRTCFHYLTMFPEDFEIPVWKLIRMWISEGFVEQKANLSLEEVAESYLKDLISRNLVTVSKFYVDGRVKTCRIHDTVFEFCKTGAGCDSENFIKEMKKSIDGDFEPPISSIQIYHRLCIHSDVLDFISSKPCGPCVRSFGCFSRDEIILPTENISDIPAGFKLLRVLDVNPIKFIRIPSELYHLVHLRYIALSFIDVTVLPAAFSKFWNLETLIFYTTSRTLEVKADIWEMIHLRHLKTNASANLLKKGKSNEQGENLQTLGTISSETLLLNGKNGSFDSFKKLENIEKLKLINDLFSDSILEGQLRLPPPYKYPPKLRSLTLSDSFLDWSQMSILGMLENLEILKLKHKAFMGKHWKEVDGGFNHLEVLQIGRTDLVSWIASGHHFPRLRRLELRNCEGLKEVPLGFADIPSFQLLDLHRCKSAAASARKICEAKQEKKREKKRKRTETIKKNGFKLSVFPPED